MKKSIYLHASYLVAALLLSSCKSYNDDDVQNQSKVQNRASIFNNITSVPNDVASYFNIDTNFYKKYLAVGTQEVATIPVVSRANVNDQALKKVVAICNLMLRTYPSYAAPKLKQEKIYLSIFGNDEYADVLPGWNTNWNPKQYAGGFGASATLRVCGFHEGNVLKNSYDRYKSENIVVHEFAHTIKDFALDKFDSSFDKKIENLYNSAKEKGKWKNTYAITHPWEYWAECVQSYFNVNALGPKDGDGVHNDINTREKLKAYDQDMYNLLEEIYKGQTIPKELI